MLVLILINVIIGILCIVYKEKLKVSAELDAEEIRVRMIKNLVMTLIVVCGASYVFAYKFVPIMHQIQADMINNSGHVDSNMITVIIHILTATFSFVLLRSNTKAISTIMKRK